MLHVQKMTSVIPHKSRFVITPVEYTNLFCFVLLILLQTTSSALKGAIQLGIGYTVGNLTSKPDRDVLMQDFYVVESVFLPRYEQKTVMHTCMLLSKWSGMRTFFHSFSPIAFSLGHLPFVSSQTRKY